MYTTPPPYPPYGGAQQTLSLDAKVSQIMKRVYVKMFLAMILTAMTAFGMYAIAPQIVYAIGTSRALYWILAIVEIGLVIWISAGLNRMSSSTATLLFILFSVVNGATLSIIFAAFTMVSIGKTFLICAATFGAMSVYGYLTNRDLSRIGSILVMALFGLIICAVVNIFWGNSTMDLIVSGLGVLIFIGLTAWDTQKIKRIAVTATPDTYGKLATIGALSLYLDFINLFLYLLRFFGDSRN